MDDDDAIDTFCVVGWHVLFTVTIYTPTDNQDKRGSKRLGVGD